jgi:two-component system LytT family sensor kinase
MLRNRWFRWIAYILGWTLVALFFSSQTFLTYKYSNGTAHWGAILKLSFSQWCIWALIAPGVLWLARKFPIEKEKLARNLAIHMGAAVAAALLHWELSNLSRHYVLGFPGSTSIAFVFHQNFLIYWILVGAISGYNYYERYREGELHSAQLSAQLSQAQLQSLRAQLHPHFLFNTLNSIAALVHRNPDEADRMIARLSDLLRISLEQVGVQEVPLAQEIEFLKRYVEIEQARFAYRLRVDLEIAPETLTARTPYLILQPLVENAIRHGIAPRAQPGRVVVSAARENGFLILQVRDDGAGLAAGLSAPAREGLGLSSTRERLSKLYGDHQRFEANNGAQGGFVVTIAIPFNTDITGSAGE